MKLETNEGHGKTVHSSVQSLDRFDWGVGGGGHEGRFSRDPLPVISAGDHREQFWHGQGCPLFDVVPSSISLSTTVSPPLPPPPRGALKDGFREAVVPH